MKDLIRLERYQRWRAVFETQQGKSVLTDLRKMAGQDKHSLTLSVSDGKVDPYFTIFNEGRRSIWLDINKCLTEPPELPEENDEDIIKD